MDCWEAFGTTICIPVCLSMRWGPKVLKAPLMVLSLNLDARVRAADCLRIQKMFCSSLRLDAKL